MHHSVLKNEILNIFKDQTIHTFVDGTLGAGGHAALILEAHPEISRYIGIDQDPVALELSREKLSKWKNKVDFVPGNFMEFPVLLEEKGVGSIDGMLLDLGVSSMQLDRPEKGFSFMKEGPLDMRMDPEGDLSAKEIVNTWSESELGRIFREYGEVRRWRAAARTIVEARKETHIQTTTQLSEILLPVLPMQKKRIHPLTLVFQALRISVNRELAVLEETLPKAVEWLGSGGRIAVISFHSLEDRIVKNTFRNLASDKVHTSGIGGIFLDKEPTVNLLTRKPIVPTPEEIHQNPRSRSSKLRAVEKRPLKNAQD